MLPSRFQSWWLASRPRTLLLIISPIVLGVVLAGVENQRFQLWPLCLTVLAAVLIQVGTNLHNDVSDFERGTDTAERLGPPRATAMGWLPAREVRVAALACFALAFALGGVLAWWGGWPIVALGLAALWSGWAYTGGRRPISASPYGEAFVVVFFGVAAVAGTAYLQSLQWSPAALWAGLMLGSHAAAVITLNNHRDRVGDARAGRRTLAIVLGERATRGLILGEWLLPFLLLPGLAVLLGGGALLALPAILLPVVGSLWRQLLSVPPGPAINALLGRAVLLQAGFTGLLVLALLLA